MISQKNTDVDLKTMQQISFTRNINRAGNTRIFFINKEAKENIFNSSKT